MRIAIIGTGISGLTAARALARVHDVTVFEAADRPGGHTNTVRVDLGDETHEVDTGFIVFNEPNYPRFTRLLDELQIETATTEMSFSVTDERSGVVSISACLTAMPDPRRASRRSGRGSSCAARLPAGR